MLTGSGYSGGRVRLFEFSDKPVADSRNRRDVPAFLPRVAERFPQCRDALVEIVFLDGSASPNLVQQLVFLDRLSPCSTSASSVKRAFGVSFTSSPSRSSRLLTGSRQNGPNS